MNLNLIFSDEETILYKSIDISMFMTIYNLYLLLYMVRFTIYIHYHYLCDNKKLIITLNFNKTPYTSTLVPYQLILIFYYFSKISYSQLRVIVSIDYYKPNIIRFHTVL